MNILKKKLLLIDTDDSRRKSRVELLAHAGYSVSLRDNHLSAELLSDETGFDIVVLALHGDSARAITYSDQLSRDCPTLPILLLTDFGAYVPPGTLSPKIEGENPAALLATLASMLAGSSHLRELPIPVGGADWRK
jgi:hypothetical protein